MTPRFLSKSVRIVSNYGVAKGIAVCVQHVVNFEENTQITYKKNVLKSIEKRNSCTIQCYVMILNTSVLLTDYVTGRKN